MSKRKPKKSSLPVKTKSQKSPSASAPATPFVPGCLTITPEEVDRLIAEAQYKQHPYGKVWQRFNLDAFSELVANIDRRGLDQEILLYQGMILEGWHRYLACLHTKTQPKFVEFKGTDLEAAERVHASGVRRQSTAEQRYASFDLLCQACPAFKQKYEQLRQRGIQQQQAGTPLSTDGQRVDVVKTKAAAAGVSRATAAKVEKVKKEKPETVADIAAGKTTANKELKKVKNTGEVKPSDSDDKPAATTAAHKTGPILETLTGITQSLEAILQQMDTADWSKEDEGKWDTAEEAVSRAITSITTKAKEGFTNARATKPVHRRERWQEQGSEITVRKLKSAYGAHALDVLDHYLDELEKDDGAMRTYKVVESLPSQQDFQELQKKHYTSTVAELVDSAFGTFEDLAGEVGDWYDNLPEGFQGSDKGSSLDDARNTLKSLEQPDVGEQIGKLEVFYLPLQGSSSRASRRDDAVGRLQAVLEVLESVQPSDGQDERNELQELISEVDNAISEADGVDFPGMY